MQTRSSTRARHEDVVSDVWIHVLEKLSESDRTRACASSKSMRELKKHLPPPLSNVLLLGETGQGMTTLVHSLVSSFRDCTQEEFDRLWTKWIRDGDLNRTDLDQHCEGHGVPGQHVTQTFTYYETDRYRFWDGPGLAPTKRSKEEWNRLSRIFSPEAANAGFGISCIIIVACTSYCCTTLGYSMMWKWLSSQLKCDLDSVFVVGTIKWDNDYKQDYAGAAISQAVRLRYFKAAFVDHIFGKDATQYGKTHTYIRRTGYTLSLGFNDGVEDGENDEVETDEVLNMLDNITSKSKNNISLNGLFFHNIH
jgi:hypothetical protein